MNQHLCLDCNWEGSPEMKSHGPGAAKMGIFNAVFGMLLGNLLLSKQRDLPPTWHCRKCGSTNLKYTGPTELKS